MAVRKLTQLEINNARHTGKSTYLNDGGGLRIRVTRPSAANPAGLRIAEYHYKTGRSGEKRKNRAISLGTLGQLFADPETGEWRAFTLADARRSADLSRAQLKAGIDPLEERRAAAARRDATLVEVALGRSIEAFTLEIAYSEWERNYLQAFRKDKGKSAASVLRRHVFPVLGSRPVGDINRVEIVEIIDSLVGAGKRRTANLVLSTMKQLLKYTCIRGKIEKNVLDGMTRREAGGALPPRKRALSIYEIAVLRDRMSRSGLSERASIAVWLLLATGARVQELTGAMTAEVDLRNRVWVIPEERTKNGRIHFVQLSEFAVGKFARLIDLSKGSKWLFPGRPSGHRSSTNWEDGPVSPKWLSKAIKDRQRTAGIKGRRKPRADLVLPEGPWTPHDLRRTFSTRLQALGIAPNVIELCLNHKRPVLEETYHVDTMDEQRRAACECIGKMLADLERGDEAKDSIDVRISSARPRTRSGGKSEPTLSFRVALDRLRRQSKATGLRQDRA